MTRATITTLAALALAGSLAPLSRASFADESTGYVDTGGIGVYYAVLPAEMIRNYPRGSPEVRMHGGPPNGEHVHHVMVALFDDATMERIADATVTARVAEIGMTGRAKSLEPMAIAGAMTYGNYFRLANAATYRVTVDIRRPGSDGVATTAFEYRHR